MKTECSLFRDPPSFMHEPHPPWHVALGKLNSTWTVARFRGNSWPTTRPVGCQGLLFQQRTGAEPLASKKADRPQTTDQTWRVSQQQPPSPRALHHLHRSVLHRTAPDCTRLHHNTLPLADVSCIIHSPARLSEEPLLSLVSSLQKHRELSPLCLESLLFLPSSHSLPPSPIISSLVHSLL